MAETTRKPAASPSIVRHPLFPTIVALWCGAVLGMASVLVSPELVGRIVVLLGIDKVLPAAAPPLGATMRALLALAMAAVGFLAGFLAARRMVSPRPRWRRIRRVAEADYDDAEDEFDTETDEHHVPLRWLRDEDWQEPAPQAPRPETAKPVPAPVVPTPDAPASDTPASEFDLAGFERLAEDRVSDERDSGEVAPDDGYVVFELDEQRAPDFDQPVVAPPAPALAAFEDVAGTYPEEADQEPAAEPEAPLAPVEHASAETESLPLEPAGPPLAQGSRAAHRLAEAPLDSLSYVELLERLALAIERRRSDPRPPGVQAAALSPSSTEGETAPTAEDKQAGPSLDEGYSSLLSLTRPESPTSVASVPPAIGGGSVAMFARSEGRPQDPEAPSEHPRAQAGETRDDTERALRSALAALQRMSGAA